MEALKTVLEMLESLLVVFGGQIVVVMSLVALIREIFEITGKPGLIRLISFACGLVLGIPIIWVFLTNTPGLTLSMQATLSIYFLLGSGLAASGLYDLKGQLTKKIL